MPDGTPKRKLYDSVFCSLFQDPRYQLELYQALHPENRDVTVDDIRDVTLEEVFMDGMYNDLGFTVGDVTILLLEDQSRWSKNITIRTLMYLGESYHRYLQATEQDFYGNVPVKLPRPELYMLYTGDQKHDEEYLSLADIYWGGDGNVLDLKVKILYGEGKDSILSQYVTFTRVYRETIRKLGKSREAVLETIRICKEQDVLKDYLTAHEVEVIDIMMALYDKDVYMKLYERRKEREGAFKQLVKLVQKGRLSLDEAAEEANMTVKEFTDEAGLKMY